MGDTGVNCNGVLDPATDRDLSANCCECNGYCHSGCCTLKTWDMWTKLNPKRNNWKCDSCNAESLSSNPKPDIRLVPLTSSDSSMVLDVIRDLHNEIASNHKEYKDHFVGIELSLKALGDPVEATKKTITVLEENNLNLKIILQENKTLLIKKSLEELKKMTYLSYNNILGAITRTSEVFICTGEMFTPFRNVFPQPWRSRGTLDTSPSKLSTATDVHHRSSHFRLQDHNNQVVASCEEEATTTTDRLGPTLPPGPIHISCRLTPHNK